MSGYEDVTPHFPPQKCDKVDKSICQNNCVVNEWEKTKIKREGRVRNSYDE